MNRRDFLIRTAAGAVGFAVCGAGPVSIREAARRVNRDVKAVHADVTALLQAGVLTRPANGSTWTMHQGGFDASNIGFNNGDLQLQERLTRAIIDTAVKIGAKTVLLPDLDAGCSLADRCPADQFAEWLKQYPGHEVVSYINCTAAIKAMSDIICTSSNAVKVVNSIPKDRKIIFAPDKNLGRYVMQQTGREMVLWNGTCMVHELFSLEKIVRLKMRHPEAKFIAHPECEAPVLEIADFIGPPQHVGEPRRCAAA